MVLVLAGLGIQVLVALLVDPGIQGHLFQILLEAQLA